MSITLIALEACTKTSSKISTTHTRYSLMTRKRNNTTKCEKVTQNRNRIRDKTFTMQISLKSLTIQMIMPGRASINRNSRTSIQSTITARNQVATSHLIWTHRSSEEMQKKQLKMLRNKQTDSSNKCAKSKHKPKKSMKNGKKNSKRPRKRTNNNTMTRTRWE